MSGCRRAKSAKSGISRCVAKGGVSVTRRSPRTLWSRPKTRVSSWCDDASIWFASSRPSSPAAVLVPTEDARLQLVRRRFHLVRELEDLLARSRQAVARRQLFEHVRSKAFLELSDASQHGRVVHPEAHGGGPH